MWGFWAMQNFRFHIWTQMNERCRRSGEDTVEDAHKSPYVWQVVFSQCALMVLLFQLFDDIGRSSHNEQVFVALVGVNFLFTVARTCSWKVHARWLSKQNRWWRLGVLTFVVHHIHIEHFLKPIQCRLCQYLAFLCISYDLVSTALDLQTPSHVPRRTPRNLG